MKHYTIKSSILRSDIILSVKPLGEDYLIGTYGGGMYLLHAETVNCLSLNRMIASGKIHLPDVKEIKRANTG